MGTGSCWEGVSTERVSSVKRGREQVDMGGGGNWVVAHPRSYISSFQVALLSEVNLSFLESLTVRQPEEGPVSPGQLRASSECG